jgi:uncharacterized membrane protein YkoI
MRKRRTWIALAVAGIALIGGGSAIAAGQRDDDETKRPITGASLQRATAAAIDHLGGGQVTEIEVGDEEGYYEVEVTLEDGSQVDVHLDESFRVIGEEGPKSESDAQGSDDRD